MTDSIASRLDALGITLPTPTAPLANYVPFVVTGKQVYISGQIPLGADGVEYVGRCGAEIDVKTGAACAKLCAINVLAQARAAAGDLENIAQIVKLVGFVNSTPDFTDQPKVINGASDFVVEVMGERGRHARSAVGVAALPFGVAVEIEAVIELK